MTTEVFKFLSELVQNNNRQWFEAHKEQYQKAKSEADSFFHKVYDAVADVDTVGAIKIYRIYRDLRFSKDKTPYKDHFGLYIGRKQPHNRGAYYLHLSPEQVFVAGGFYGPEKDDLYRIRKELELEGEAFLKILNSKPIQQYFGGELAGEELKSAPKGFAKDDPMVAYIRKKQFYLMRSFAVEDALSDRFFSEVVDSFKAMRPFFEFMTTALTTNLNGEPIL